MIGRGHIPGPCFKLLDRKTYRYKCERCGRQFNKCNAAKRCPYCDSDRVKELAR